MVYETNPYNTLRIKGFFVVDEDNGKVNYESINDNSLLDAINQLEYIKDIYDTNICKGIERAILDLNKIEKKDEEKIEEVKIEEIKEGIKA